MTTGDVSRYGQEEQGCKELGTHVGCERVEDRSRIAQLRKAPYANVRSRTTIQGRGERCRNGKLFEPETRRTALANYTKLHRD